MCFVFNVTIDSYYVPALHNVAFSHWKASVLVWGRNYFFIYYCNGAWRVNHYVNSILERNRAIERTQTSVLPLRPSACHTLARRIQSATSQMKLCATYRQFLLLCHLCPWPLAVMFVRSNVLQLNTDLKFTWQRENYKYCKYEVILRLTVWRSKFIWADFLFTKPSSYLTENTIYNHHKFSSVIMFKTRSRTSHVNCTVRAECVGFFFNVEGGCKYSNHPTLKVTHLTFQIAGTHV